MKIQYVMSFSFMDYVMLSHNGTILIQDVIGTLFTVTCHVALGVKSAISSIALC